MAQLVQNIYWLEKPPDDFKGRCRALLDAPDGSGTEIGRLAQTNLNTNQLTSLSGKISTLQDKSVSLAPLSDFHLGILGNATTNLFSAALPGVAARYGLSLTITEGEYNQIVQEALDPQSAINTAKPDAVLLVLDHRNMGFGNSGGAEEALDFVKMVRDGLADGCGAPVIFQSLACPPEPLFGSFDYLDTATLRRQILAYNTGLAELATEYGDYFLDTAGLAETVGTQNWQEPAHWHLYKLPFSPAMLPIFLDHLARVLGAIRGKSRKCLVLDLDNTLWGGVIGDDGMDGIKLGQGDGAGEAFLEVQKMARALRERGIILAVCSKNEDAIAREPFKSHPEMVLSLDDISVFVANWTDKATNLEAIADQLDIGLDAMVFLDDNPAERAQVRAELPMVAVPEIGDDPSFYVRTVLNAGYFEAVSFSDEDRNRAGLYAANAARSNLKKGSRNIDAFLESLAMKIDIGPFNDVNMGRVTQLINKTNQFNLTTKRHTQAEVEAFAGQADTITLQARLVDRFGDNGIISVVMARLAGKNCDITNWLMSCRVLGRRVEEAILQELVTCARQKGATRLIGHYIPSEKNAMVADHFRNLGFELESDQGGETHWGLDLGRLDLAKLSAKPLPIERTTSG